MVTIGDPQSGVWTMRMSGLASVRTVQGLLKAEVSKSLLESHGIPTTLEYESAGRVIGVTVDGLGEVQVLVSARQARWARRLLMRGRRPFCHLRHSRRGRSLRREPSRTAS